MKKKCIKCDKEKDIELFKERKMKRGMIRSSVCDDCKRKRKQILLRETKLKCIEYKGGKCSICGYDKCPRALDFHHVDPSQKKYGIGYMITQFHFEPNKEMFFEELDKCILVCSNCHRELHEKEIDEKVKFKHRNFVKRKDENKPCRELLDALIWEMSIEDVGNVLSAGAHLVRRWIKEYNLKPPGKVYWAKKYGKEKSKRCEHFTKEELEEMLKERTTGEIERENGLAEGAILKLSHKYGLKTNDYRYFASKRLNEKLLSLVDKEELEKMICDMTMKQIGEKFDISKHHVRRLLKLYEIENPRVKK